MGYLIFQNQILISINKLSQQCLNHSIIIQSGFTKIDIFFNIKIQILIYKDFKIAYIHLGFI